ncbi:MAG: NAD(P)/FAD-dependent oxidoreductase [Gammaproteobacteria bacterium]|nr:NAD(P)/FAD-dependent oxidoreductase [Gammaproteobacteria bacterium]
MSLAPVKYFAGKPEVLILGAGAAGLMCAIVAARRGRKVLVLERSNKPGKKILMSGGGRCNFTNLYVEPSRFLSSNPHFCKSALSRYTQWDFIELVERHQIAYHDKGEGQLFCDHSSREILDMLLQECGDAGVQILTDCETQSVEKASRFELTTSAGSISAESLIVATGGLSIPKLGGSGFGYDLARQFGLSVLPLRAGLVPFTFSDPLKAITERLSGMSLDVRLYTQTKSFSDAMLFTHRGLSGPAVLQLSSYWHIGESIGIDLLPKANLPDWLRQQKRRSPRAVLRTLLAEILPRALVLELQALWWPQRADTTLAEWSDHSLEELAIHLSNWQVKPSGTEGYRTAEVTLGGVDTELISSRTMEFKNVPGLFFIGEVLDVTGHLGGFNFQWAWSSGYAAGEVA